MKSLLFTIILLVAMTANAQFKPKLSSFKLQDVKLLPGIFKDAENTDLKYIMEMVPDRLLAPYLREAGLPKKAESYTNWENTGLDGHICGHYLTALSLMYASTDDKKVLDRLNYMLDELKRCQDKNGDGYLGGVPGSKALWEEVGSGKINGLFSQKWVPLYNIHKMYAGLRDAYLMTNSKLAKDMLISFSDWMLKITSKLDENKMQTWLRTEQGGINEVFADVYAITGDKKYLDLAVKFSHKAILEPLENNQDKLDNLHANTQIPKVIGFERIAELNGDSLYRKAAHFFWQTVVEHRTVAIGGNSVREHFNPVTDFTGMVTSEQGPETCNTYNMLKLTKLLYDLDGSEKYIEYYERALYNHILSSQHPVTGGFVYFTPMRSGHYRVYSQPQTSMWCCVGSGIENHAKYSEMIYAHNTSELFVNLFISSRLTWKEKGLVLNQQTHFPDTDVTTLTIEDAKNSSFTLNVRYPVWVDAKALKISVNGKPQSYTSTPGSYVAINRVWKKGDKVTVTLPMRTTTEKMPDGSDYVAVFRGPIVLAAKTDTTNMKGLFADDSRMGHVASGKQYPLQEMPMFVSNNSDITGQIKEEPNKPMTFLTSNLIYPEKYKNLELIPFFRLHDSRYVIYWQKITTEKLEGLKQKLAEQEAIKQKLDAITVDVVAAGEQQPESDHFIASDNSNTGVYKDSHWRNAKGWFSYKMTDKNKLSQSLRITYSGRDRNSSFKIMVNDQLIKDVVLDATHGNDFYTVDYTIPDNIVQSSNGVLTVKFVAAEGSVAGSIYEVRLLKQQNP